MSATRFIWEDHVQSIDGKPNRFLGVRFDRTGRFLTERGNTVVRHVTPGSDTEAALAEVREALMGLPCGDHFAYTDIQSYHMTVFEGALDTRRKPHHWPDGLPYDTDIETATRFLNERLDGFEPLGDFAMRPTDVTPFGISLTGATPEDEKTARAWRDAFTGPFGYRAPEHDAYRFHITLAYVKDWLPAAAIPEYKIAMKELTEDFIAAIPVVELEPPAFCTFEDMNAFMPVRVFR